MIPVRENKDGTLEMVSGNPTLLSLDGKVKAPLVTILHESWTAEERAAFGVYIVEPATIPDGKRQAASPIYEKRDGAVVQVLQVEDIPAEPVDTRTAAQRFDAMLARFGLTPEEFRTLISDRAKA